MRQRITLLAVGAIGILGLGAPAVSLGAEDVGPGSQPQSAGGVDGQSGARGPSNAEAKVAQESGCPEKKLRQIDNEHAHTPRHEPKRPIEFTVHETSSVLNFGSSRDTRANYIVLKASREIPKGIYFSDFEIDSLEPMRRIGEASLESVHLRAPRFTPPHFFNHRKEVGFNLCVSASGGDPGTYTGQFQFVGPGAIETATLTQTAQLKAENATFVFWLVLVLIGALVLLIVNHLVLPATPKGRKEWLARIILIAISLAAAASAILIAWSQNPTWGENLWVAIGALIATAFAAAGVGSTLSAAAGQIKASSDGTEGNGE